MVRTICFIYQVILKSCKTYYVPQKKNAQIILPACALQHAVLFCYYPYSYFTLTEIYQ